MEKKTFMKSFLEEVNIYEAEQEDGRILRSFKFRFPVFFNDQELRFLPRVLRKRMTGDDERFKECLKKLITKAVVV